MTLSEVMLFNH